MIAAVCNYSLLYIQIFSSTSQRIRRVSGGFTSQIVRLKHSTSQPSISHNVCFVQWYRLQCWCHCIRHPLPSCVTACFTHEKMSQICFRTGMAHRSLDGFRRGCRICGLRSVFQPSAYRWRARGPAPTRRIEIVSLPSLPFGRIIISTPSVDPQRQIDYVHNACSALAISKFIDYDCCSLRSMDDSSW
jgi:hypothetical protein